MTTGQELILRGDTPLALPSEVVAQATAQANGDKAQKVAEVVAAEHSRERSIEPQVAIKCAAEVAIAMIPYIKPEGDSISLAQVGALIDRLIEPFKAGVRV